MKYKLARNGALYRLEPWAPALEPLLSYTRKEFGFGARRTRPTFTREKLFEVQADGAGVFPSGLFMRVARFLKQQGHEFEITDHRDLAQLMPLPDFTQVEQLRPGQDKILVEVTRRDGGLLVGGTAIGKSWLIVQICKMYPTLKVVVVTPRRPVVAQLYENLMKALGPATVGKYGGSGPEASSPRRVSVSTVKSILKAPIKECDLLLFDEVHAVGANQIADHLAYIQHARKFGFTATPGGRGDGAELVIEALFGPVLIDIPYEDAVGRGLVARIEAHRYHVPSAEIGSLDGGMASCKRNAYWRNRARNETIAAVARGVPAEDQTLIMVETLEHAIYLHRLLPEYKVVHCGSVDPSRRRRGISPGELAAHRLDDKRIEIMRKQFARGDLLKVISTTTWREGCDFPQLAVLIRADGMTSSIASNQIPGRLSRLSEGKDVGVLVDFGDEYSQWSQQRAQARFRIYRKTGWRVVDRTLTATAGGENEVQR